MTDPVARARAVWNWQPSTTKIEIPISELRLGDLVGGDVVREIHADSSFIHFYVTGKPYPQGLKPDQYIQIERKVK